ncbi:hypothetical protein DFP72DRAFT_853998 [Ephemerocybe angulata]|uniref:Uncharacterized protein n=1 Tax=Ephemerocybe angulata TaxID=980116 RepID=A0A8H6HIS8_9AGAR|nr:hypothetical protein DFP72DRAFT_853998 [Tulosesus angulatus]
MKTRSLQNYILICLDTLVLPISLPFKFDTRILCTHITGGRLPLPEHSVGIFTEDNPGNTELSDLYSGDLCQIDGTKASGVGRLVQKRGQACASRKAVQDPTPLRVNCSIPTNLKSAETAVKGSHWQAAMVRQQGSLVEIKPCSWDDLRMGGKCGLGGGDFRKWGGGGGGVWKRGGTFAASTSRIFPPPKSVAYHSHFERESRACSFEGNNTKDGSVCFIASGFTATYLD